MEKQLISTRDITNSRVWYEKPKKKNPDAVKKLGRVRACVFHPREKRCVGIIVKRPDIVWMVNRADEFVAYNGFDLIDDQLLIHKDDPQATGKEACKALGIDLDMCVLWIGLPVICKDGTECGFVDSVLYDINTGAIDSLVLTQGATAKALLGVRNIPANMIRGFRRGIGTALYEDGGLADDENGEAVCGAILVDDAVKNVAEEGGLAETAGTAAAHVSFRAHQAAEKAKPTLDKLSKVSETATNAVDRGVDAINRQADRTTGMFSAFKREYDKAVRGEDEPASTAKAAAKPAAATKPAAAAAKPAAATSAKAVGSAVATNATASATSNAKKKPATEDEEYSSERAGQAIGSQLKKASGMFAAFKEEYDKARNGE